MQKYSVAFLRHVASKWFNCKEKDSYLQWYFRRTIFKLWVETGGEYDWRVSTEWKQVPGAWVRAFKTKCRRGVLISGMCLWLCLRYEGRILLDLCSEPGYSPSPSPWQTLIWWPRLDWSPQWTAALWYLWSVSIHGTPEPLGSDADNGARYFDSTCSFRKKVHDDWLS